MKHVCREGLEGFDRLLQLPEGDSERTEVEACPRCGSRFLAFQMFLRADDVPGADPEDAQKRLTELIHGNAAQLPGETAEARTPWWDWFRRSMSTPRAVVPALIAIVAIAVGVWHWQPSADRSPELRATRSSVGTVTLLSVSTNADGSLDVSWEPVTSADAYEVRLLRADLTEIRRVGPVTTRSIHIDATETPSEGGSFWQLVALQGGDEIAASDIREIPPPVSR